MIPDEEHGPVLLGACGCLILGSLAWLALVALAVVIWRAW